jgi:glucose/arabinose dehydrogenase
MRYPQFARCALVALTFGVNACVDRVESPPPEPVDTIVSAATVPSGFVDETFVSGLSNPTAMEFAPDGRLFVTQQGGQLRVIKNGALLSTPFLTVTVNSSGERGLLGVTFDPAFATNNFVYVYYTATSPAIHNRISRFTANGDVAVAGSEVQLVNLENLSSATNHNGGAIHFGPDGKLYAAVGENANGSNAQTLANRLGKMLRVNADGTIPTDNPFFNTAAGNNRQIWALGLRNPFTFTFQRTTGRMFINDVGEVTWEEINDGIGGSNYGWPTTEGPTTDPRFRAPLFAYRHSNGTPTGCAITGGAFYNPVTTTFPSSFTGKYFYADFCSGFIRVFDPAAGTDAAFATGVSSPVDLKVHSDGSLYYLARGNGTVGRVRPSVANQPPQITTQPQSQTRAVGQSVTFSVAASGTAPLSFQWQRNGANIAGATSSSFTIASVATSDNGAMFRAVVTNAFGTATSNAATLTVTANAPPTVTITAPAAGSLYSGGNVINFAGTATDPETGALPASAFTWRVDFHHDTHFHPHLADTSGITSGSFTVPTRGEVSANVWFRIHLTARDPAGLTATTFRDVLPRTSTITLQTSPAGLQVTLDGQPVTTPLSVTGVVGVIRALGVVSPQTSGGTTYQFVSWSDAGAASHEIVTPATNTTFTATYQPMGGVTQVFSDDFEIARGWTVNPNANDTATTGQWQRGNPQGTSSGGSSMQLDPCAGGSTNCLVTGLSAGSSVGVNDIDGGTTSIQSPAIALPATGVLTLDFSYYMAHLNNASSADFLRVIVVPAGASGTTVFQELGAANTDAAVWANTSVDISAFAGQSIRVLIQAADASGASLVEAAVDNVTVTRR